MRRKKLKPYWQMTTAELAEVTKEFDEELVADRARPLSPEMRARWRRAKAKQRSQPSTRDEVIIVCLDRDLLARCTRLARKRRLTRDSLISQSLRALLAAEDRRE
jgi:hypothetical protein